MLHHLRTGWDRRDQDNVLLLHYADLRADVVGEMTALARALGFPQSDARIRELAGHSSIRTGCANVREQLAPEVEHGGWRSAADFFRAGRMRAWADAFDQRTCGVRRPRVRLTPTRSSSLGHGGRTAASGGCDPGPTWPGSHSLAGAPNDPVDISH